MKANSDEQSDAERIELGDSDQEQIDRQLSRIAEDHDEVCSSDRPSITSLERKELPNKISTKKKGKSEKHEVAAQPSIMLKADRNLMNKAKLQLEQGILTKMRGDTITEGLKKALTKIHPSSFGSVSKQNSPQQAREVTQVSYRYFDNLQLSLSNGDQSSIKDI